MIRKNLIYFNYVENKFRAPSQKKLKHDIDTLQGEKTSFKYTGKLVFLYNIPLFIKYCMYFLKSYYVKPNFSSNSFRNIKTLHHSTPRHSKIQKRCKNLGEKAAEVHSQAHRVLWHPQHCTSWD